jgi:hypothetical protein
VTATADLGPGAAAVAPGIVPLDALSWEAADAPQSHVRFSLRTSGVYNVGLAESTPTRRAARVVTSPYGTTLELTDPVEVKLDGVVAPVAPPVTVPIVGDRVDAIEMDDKVISFAAPETNVSIATHSSVRALAGSSSFVAGGSDFTPARICGQQPTGAAEPGIMAIRGGIELSSRAGVACTSIPIPALPNEGFYRVQFHVRSISARALPVREPNCRRGRHGPITATSRLRRSSPWGPRRSMPPAGHRCRAHSNEAITPWKFRGRQ